jgi:WD40 repeat protein
MLALCLMLGLGGSAVLAAQPAENPASSGERLVLVRIGTIKGYLDGSTPQHFSPNGRYLFTQGHGRIPDRIWSVPDLGKAFELKRGPRDAPPTGPLYDSRSSLAVTTTITNNPDESDSREEKVWSLPFWKRRAFPPDTRISAISPDGRFFLVDRIGSGFGFWSLPEGRLVKLLPNVNDNFVQFSPTMPLVAMDHGLMTQNEIAKDAKLKRMFGEKPKVRIHKTSLWSVPDGKLVASLPGALGIGFSGNGRILACYGQRGGVTLWSVPQGKLLDSFGDDEPELIDLVSNYKLMGRLSPDGRHVAYRNEKSTRLWSVQDRKLVATIDSADSAGRGRAPTSLAFSPDSLILATSLDRSGQSRLWSVQSGKLLATLPDPYGIAFSPDGRTLASNGNRGVSVHVYTRGREVDWSQDKMTAGRQVRAEAKLSTAAAVYAGDRISLDVSVRNSGATDLTQLWAATDSDALSFRQLVPLIGRVKAATTVQRRASVVLPVEHKAGKFKGLLVFREANKKVAAPAPLPFMIEVKPLPRPDFTLLARPAELQLSRGQKLDVPVVVKNQIGAAIADLRVTVGVSGKPEGITLDPAVLEFGTVADNTKAERRVAIRAANDARTGPVIFDLRAGDSRGRVFAVQQFALRVKE